MSETKTKILIESGDCQQKAVWCLDCWDITFVELPKGLIRRTWTDDPLPVGWRWVISAFPSGVGDVVRAQCNNCVQASETSPEALHFRIANARNLNFRPDGSGG